jgi:histidinol dehydrogenase
MAFTFAMAQGAHNAPRLWGDKTVRPQDKITGLGSGFVAAGKVCAVNSTTVHAPLHMVLVMLLTSEGALPRNLRWNRRAFRPALHWSPR